MRTFVALNLAPDVRATLWGAAAPLRHAFGSAVAWVAEPNLHVTLRFLGDRDSHFVESLSAGLAARLASSAAFDVQLSGVGAFPGLGRPRILWIGVRSNPSVARLYQRVDDVCASRGVPRESRPFHPHVTIGRVRERSVLPEFETAAAAIRVGTSDRIRAVDVMESVLGRGGANYRVVASAPLREDA